MTEAHVGELVQCGQCLVVRDFDRLRADAPAARVEPGHHADRGHHPGCQRGLADRPLEWLADREPDR